MLLGFISLLLTATSSVISNICISSKFYDNSFTPCTQSEIDEQNEENSSSEKRKLYMGSVLPHLYRRMLTVNKNTCKEARYNFLSYFLIIFYILRRTLSFFHPNNQLTFETFLWCRVMSHLFHMKDSSNCIALSL